MFWKTFLDLIYPRVCCVCERNMTSEVGHLCWDCTAALPIISHPYCSVCGDPIEGKVDEDFVCYACSDQRPHFVLARSAVRYRGAARDLLQHFKYHRRLWVAKDLTNLLRICVETHYADHDFDAIMPVPLYPARRRERGFNQAEILAALLARDMGKPLASNALLRIRSTLTQTRLTARERAFNVKGAFKLRQGHTIQGRRVLLVDDVMTTGATVNECARTLKEGGATEVVVVTVARG